MEKALDLQVVQIVSCRIQVSFSPWNRNWVHCETPCSFPHHCRSDTVNYANTAGTLPVRKVQRNQWHPRYGMTGPTCFTMQYRNQPRLVNKKKDDKGGAEDGLSRVFLDIYPFAFTASSFQLPNKIRKQIDFPAKHVIALSDDVREKRLSFTVVG